VDADDNVYVAGRTASTNFPVMNASQLNSAGMVDVFVMKLDHQGFNSYALLYSTYLGGSALELGNDIAVDSQGRAYVTGMTQATDFPVTTYGSPNAPCRTALSRCWIRRAPASPSPPTSAAAAMKPSTPSPSMPSARPT
jgi:hypothetical protein